MTGVRILLVDDEKLLLSLLRRHLERTGHHVVAVESAELALEAIAAQAASGWEPEVLIADETLPGRTGTSLAIELLTDNPRLRCLLCSGYPLSLESLPAALRARAAILQKPYLPAALERAVSDLMVASPGSIPPVL